MLPMSTTVLARFSTIGEAEIARSALDAAGIEVHIADENLIAIDWLASNALGGVKLLVRVEDRERAEAVIASPALEAPADAVPEEMVVAPTVDEDDRCPTCGSSDIRRFPRLGLFALASLALGAVGFVFAQPEMVIASIAAAAIILASTPSHRCASCGERFNGRPDRDAPAPAAAGPDAKDLIEVHCPRCGSPDFYRIEYRRLKAIPLLIHSTILIAAPMLLFLPKRQCQQCGMKA